MVHDSGEVKHVVKWQDKLRSALTDLHTTVERDSFVIDQFKKSGKDIRQVLRTSRSIVGYETSPKTVVDKGFRGLCAAILLKTYKGGPKSLSKAQLKTWRKAFKTFFEKTGGQPNLIHLQKALTKIGENSFFKDNPKWFVYCCSRMAGKNAGMVNMNGVESYMKNAMRKHKTKNPPPVDYDDPKGIILSQISMGFISPKTAQKRIKKAMDIYKALVPSLLHSEYQFASDARTAGAPVDGGMRGSMNKGHKKKKKKKTIKMDWDDFIKEHKRLLSVLRSPSHKDDLEEAREQQTEVTKELAKKCQKQK